MIVWIAGASSGLGLSIAKAVQSAGHTVIIGARSYQAPCMKDGMHCLPLDVTNQVSVDAFAAEALKIAPKVDALINCAAILMLGSCEETSPEEYNQVMDTNFIGMVRMNQAVLPMMRKAGEGRIIMLSSINGLLGIPYQSAYTAAKHAVEGYAECLSQETYRFGIQVCLVEPGDHRGGSQHTRKIAAAMGEASPYRQEFASTVSVIRHDEANGSDPDRLGKAVAKQLEKRRMLLRLRVASADQHLAVILHDVLPPSLNNWILRTYYIKRTKK